MKILQVVATMDPQAGGISQGIRHSIPQLHELGCENEVVCLDDPTDSYGLFDPFVIHRLGEKKGPWAWSRKLVPWLREHLPNYDAIVLNGLWLYQSHAVTTVIGQLRRGDRKSAPRMFVMSHGMLDPWFQRDPSRRLKAIRNWFVWKAIERHTIETADGLLFTCQRELELARTTFRPYRPQREINVGYGVAEPPTRSPQMTSAFRSACPELGERPYLLFLSRLHPKKGVDLLIRAFADVVRSVSPSPPAPLPEAGRGEPNRLGAKIPDLVIAGPLDSAYARQMQALANTLGLSQRVHFPGMLTGDAKWGGFYDCEAFVLPSHQENFGIAVVEALACSKPVLISDQVNICDEIERDQAGWVQPDTIEGTLGLLRRWTVTDHDTRQAMSQAARDCYENHFLPQQAARRLLDAISA